MTFLAGIPGVQTVFPHLTAARMQTNYMGLTITELYYGGAFACLPLLWGLAALPLARRRLGSRRDLRTVIRLVLVCTAALAVVDCQMAGMLYRYQSDWLGPLLLAAALAADGETRLRDPGHIPRGYENLPAALRGLGAEIS